MDDRRGAGRPKSDEEAGLGPAGRRGHDDVVRHETARSGAVQQLERCEDLADRAGDARTTDADDRGTPAGVAQFGDDPVDQGLALRASVARGDVDRRPEQLVESHAGVRWIGRWTREHEVDCEAGPRSGRRSQPGVVRPSAAGRDEGVGAICDGGADEELEVAELVATERQREEVLTLDPDLGATADRGREPRERL